MIEQTPRTTGHSTPIRPAYALDGMCTIAALLRHISYVNIWNSTQVDSGDRMGARLSRQLRLSGIIEVEV